MNLEELLFLAINKPNETLDTLAMKMVFEKIEKILPPCIEIIKMAEEKAIKANIEKRAKDAR